MIEVDRVQHLRNGAILAPFLDGRQFFNLYVRKRDRIHNFNHQASTVSKEVNYSRVEATLWKAITFTLSALILSLSRIRVSIVETAQLSTFQN